MSWGRPWGVMPEKHISRIEDAARQGNLSIFVSGVDPGFANDLIPFALAGTCQRIEQVRCLEIADYATYDGSEVMFNVMGLAKPLDELPMLLRPGVLTMAWGRRRASASSTPPGCGQTCDPTGRNPHWAAARIASRSPASRRTPSTSARPAARATTTTTDRGAAGRIVNAIPAVIAAPPGIRTTLDLPLVTGMGLYRPMVAI